MTLKYRILEVQLILQKHNKVIFYDMVYLRKAHNRFDVAFNNVKCNAIEFCLYFSMRKIIP